MSKAQEPSKAAITLNHPIYHIVDTETNRFYVGATSYIPWILNAFTDDVRFAGRWENETAALKACKEMERNNTDYDGCSPLEEGRLVVVRVDFTIVSPTSAKAPKKSRIKQGKYGIKAYGTEIAAEGQYLRKYYRVSNIVWDTDGAPVEGLPTSAIVNCVGEEDIADALSDQYGWLVKSFDIEED